MRLSQPAKIVIGSVLASTAIVAAWAAASRMSGGSIAPPPLAYLTMAITPTYWKSRIAKPTIMFESSGRYDAANLNTDGAGLSFGLISWAQKPGSLGVLLQAMQRRDPARFATIFGPSADRLVAATLPGGVVAVDGAYLWQEPWISRFRAAGRDPVFRAVQDDLIFNGPYMAGAISAAMRLGGVPTERGLSLLFDRNVQQGPAKVASLLGSVTGTTFDERVRSLGQLAVNATPSTWRSDVSRRVASILSDPWLTDKPVTMTA